MSLLNEAAIVAASAEHPLAEGVVYSYGTAGFRTVASVLDSVLFRVGILASLRSKKLDGQVIGVMVTASHNPAKDNGVKLVDPQGEMLIASWEEYASLLANATDSTQLLTIIHKIIQETEIDLSIPAIVIYGHDTRPSCPALINALEAGLNVMEAEARSAGLVTTPQLHYLVKAFNTQNTTEPYGIPTVQGYYQKLATAYNTLTAGQLLPSSLTVDCANGVGAPKLLELLAQIGTENLKVIIAKDDISNPTALNYQCGADYVKTQQKAPPGIELIGEGLYCSFDGDADRIIFYFADGEGKFHLLDGDKIAGLIGGYLIGLVAEAGLKLEVGVVQTAYANGSSTDYLKNVLSVPVSCVATGVKHLHHAAQDYSIGVYFEANGHGTVLFSPSATATIKSSEPNSPSAAVALKSLLAITELINQTVGDALSDMLLILVILIKSNLSPTNWNANYSDLPNRLVKVIVSDRFQFSTTDAERKLVTPVGLQGKVDKLVEKYHKGRAFVRPSGTEDCVRVYAEAATRLEADELAQHVANLVFETLGKGTRPALFT